MKILLILFFFNLLFYKFSYSNESDPRAEIFVANNTASELLVKFYPEGCIFNGDSRSVNNLLPKYSLKANNTDDRRGSGILLSYIFGLDGFATPISLDGFFKIPAYQSGFEYGHYLLLSHDASATASMALDGLYGYGKYKLEIYDQSFNFIVTIPIDWSDFDYPYPNVIPVNERMCQDLYLFINDITVTPPGITYRWNSCLQVTQAPGDTLPLYNTETTNGEIHVYKQYYSYRNPLIKERNLGNFDTESDFRRCRCFQKVCMRFS